MGSFISNMLGGAVQGFLMTGNPIGAAAGAAAGAITGGATGAPTTVGNLGNIAQGAWQSGILASQEQMNYRNALFQLATQEQASEFDNMTSEKSEMMRESNTLRTVAMEQRKSDNEITKEFIKSIT